MKHQYPVEKSCKYYSPVCSRQHEDVDVLAVRKRIPLIGLQVLQTKPVLSVGNLICGCLLSHDVDSDFLKLVQRSDNDLRRADTLLEGTASVDFALRSRLPEMTCPEAIGRLRAEIQSLVRLVALMKTYHNENSSAA